MLKSAMLLLLLISSFARMNAAEVVAELSTDQVEVGQGALLSVKVEGGAADRMPEIPAVEGLVINHRGQSTQMSFTNGSLSRSVTYQYVAGSHNPGEYQIPAIKVVVDGAELSTQPLKLTVRAANAAPAGMEDDATGGGGGDHGFLTFQLATNERQHVYPGEIAPVRIRAYFPAGTSVSLSGPPRPEGSAFTLHNLTQEPEQSAELINGVRHQVVTWYGGLSATKAGSYPASFELEGTVAVRDHSARRRRGGSLFDDFFAPMIRKDLVLQTQDPPQIEVRELPQAGRPEDFSGAIGHFEFESVDVPEQLTTGEPAPVEARIHGSGNFALLGEPQMLPGDRWKSYEGTEEFIAGDAASFAGTKAFRFTAVPLVPGEDEVRLGFSYFDPNKGEYRTVESVPQRVEIRGEAPAPPEPEPERTSVDAPPEPDLAPLSETPGAVASFVPLSERDWFYPALGGCGVLALGLVGLGLWREREVDPREVARREEKKAVEEAAERARKAAETGDAAGFFMASREAIGRRVAGRLAVNPAAVTLAEVARVADPEGVGLFREADRIDYSGGAHGVADLGKWRDVLQQTLAHLEPGGHGDEA